MRDNARWLSPACFGLVLFCFLLPFVTVACPGGSFTFSGLDLLTGKEIEGERMAPELFAWLAALAAVGGLLAGVTRAGSRAAKVAAGIVGILALLLLQWRMGSSLTEEAGAMAELLRLRPGFWLALLGFAAGAAADALADGFGPGRRGSRARPKDDPVGSP